MPRAENPNMRVMALTPQGMMPFGEAQVRGLRVERLRLEVMPNPEPLGEGLHRDAPKFSREPSFVIPPMPSEVE